MSSCDAALATTRAGLFNGDVPTPIALFSCPKNDNNALLYVLSTGTRSVEGAAGGAGAILLAGDLRAATNVLVANLLVLTLLWGCIIIIIIIIIIVCIVRFHRRRRYSLPLLLMCLVVPNSMVMHLLLTLRPVGVCRCAREEPYLQLLARHGKPSGCLQGQRIHFAGSKVDVSRSQ